MGSRLLKRLSIERPLACLNEHNESEFAPQLLEMLKQGQSLALISDCGTPVFADPGSCLVPLAIQAGISVTAVPGASSLMAALVCSGFACKEFYYVGFLPRTPHERQQKLRALMPLKALLVIYETPYRLRALLEDVSATFEPSLPVALCTELTTPVEHIYRGTLQQLKEQITQQPLKCEFVLLLNNQRPPQPSHHQNPRQQAKRHR